jgi:uncharacterized DUF497 family protein
MLKFEWDEEKAKANLAEHKISFDEARLVFLDPYRLTEPDNERFDYGEERFQTIGIAKNLILLVVIYTDRDKNGIEIIRIISARRAKPHERKIYGNRKLLGK